MGHFVGEVEVEWIEESTKKKLPWYKKMVSFWVDWDADRKMKLKERIFYVDDKSCKWNAHKGAIIDGASIPRFFWRFIGSPFVGDYRKASIIHDVYCQKKNKPSEKVHQAFCEMLRDSDVPSAKRKLMCFAVKRFGPRW